MKKLSLNFFYLKIEILISTIKNNYIGIINLTIPPELTPTFIAKEKNSNYIIKLKEKKKTFFAFPDFPKSC
jgi:hypothetical protein